MLKLALAAAVSVAALTVAPLPVVTGSAFAQGCLAAVGANCRRPPREGGGESTTYKCSDQLGYLRRVYEEELEEIEDSQLVAVVPVCLGEDYGIMRADGNAGALRQTIADNEAMMEALFRKNFGYDDVVGIRMTGDESVILYVHPFHK